MFFPEFSGPFSWVWFPASSFFSYFSSSEFGGVVVCGLGGLLLFGSTPGQPVWVSCFQDGCLLPLPQCRRHPRDRGGCRGASAAWMLPGLLPPPLVTTSQGRGSSCLLSGSPQGEVGGTGALLPGEPPPCSFSRPVHLGGCPVLFGAGGLMERLREGLTEDLVAGTALGPPPLWECRQLTQSQQHRCLHTHPPKSGPKITVSLCWALHWGCAGDVVRPALGLHWGCTGPGLGLQ